MRRSAPLASAGVALACAALAWAPAAVIQHLAFDRQAILGGEIWRLWSAHLVHFSLQHALLDGAVFFFVASVAEHAIGTRRLGIALALGAPFIGLGLLAAVPGLAYYRGASGLATMAALLAGAALWRGSAARRRVLALLALGLAARTAAEACGISASVAGLPDHVALAWQAHVLGASAGGLMVLAGRRRFTLHNRAIVGIVS